MTNLETSALNLLFQRLAWPSGLVRERACVSLGSLLADEGLGAEVTKATLAWMAEQNLESVAALGLLVFYQAKSLGVPVPPLDVVSERLSKPSLLSWLIARDLYEETDGEPVLADLHSGNAPNGFAADPFFLDNVENFVPPVYLNHAQAIDQKKCPGFLMQWAFEWTKLVEVTNLPLRWPDISFWTHRDGNHLVCWDLPLAEVYRSAFLRALAWAVELKGMRPNTSLWFAAETCPIDLGLWSIPPGRPPATWPKSPPMPGSVDTIPGWLTTEIAGMWQRQLGDDWLIAKASGRIQETGSSAYDLDIVGVIQSCIGAGTPDMGTFCAEDSRRMIAWQPERPLFLEGSYSRKPADGWQEQYSDWLVWRLAALAKSNTVPRWQWWRSWRGVWLPSPILAKKVFEFRCAKDAVIVAEDNAEVARWFDWTHNLQETATANLTPSTGQMLLIRRSLVESEAAKLGGVFAWICKITTYDRKYGYGAFTEAHFVLDFGTTRIVRGRT